MKKEKSLQKFTVIEKLNSVKDVEVYLKDHPDKVDDVLLNIQERINKTYQEKQGFENKLSKMAVACYHFQKDEDQATFIKNITYQINHQIISGTVHNYILKNGHFPNIFTIKEETGLSRVTINKHLKDGLRSENNALVENQLKYMSTIALQRLYLIGIRNSNTYALKSFIELTRGRKATKHEIRNYIQINNLKITQEDLQKLSEEKIQEIETMICNYLNENQ